MVAPSSRGRQMGNRIERVEALIDRLVSNGARGESEAVVVDGDEPGPEAPMALSRDYEPRRVLVLREGVVVCVGVCLFFFFADVR